MTCGRKCPSSLALFEEKPFMKINKQVRELNSALRAGPTLQAMQLVLITRQQNFRPAYLAGCASDLSPLAMIPNALLTLPAACSKEAHSKYKRALPSPTSWFFSVLKVSLASSWLRILCVYQFTTKPQVIRCSMAAMMLYCFKQPTTATYVNTGLCVASCCDQRLASSSTLTIAGE